MNKLDQALHLFILFSVMHEIALVMCLRDYVFATMAATNLSATVYGSADFVFIQCKAYNETNTVEAFKDEKQFYYGALYIGIKPTSSVAKKVGCIRISKKHAYQGEDMHLASLPPCKGSRKTLAAASPYQSQYNESCSFNANFVQGKSNSSRFL